jgi:sugar phosphate permease
MSKIRGLRWWMIGLIMLGSIINYLTRSTLSVAAPTLLKDLNIGTAAVLVGRRHVSRARSCCNRSAATCWT